MQISLKGKINEVLNTMNGLKSVLGDDIIGVEIISETQSTNQTEVGVSTILRSKASTNFWHRLTKEQRSKEMRRRQKVAAARRLLDNTGVKKDKSATKKLSMKKAEALKKARAALAIKNKLKAQTVESQRKLDIEKQAEAIYEKIENKIA